MIRPAARLHGLHRAIGPSAGQIASHKMEDLGEVQLSGLTVPGFLYETILEQQALEGQLPQGPMLERHRMVGTLLQDPQRGQAPKDFQLVFPVVEGHLLNRPRQGSLRLEGQAKARTSLVKTGMVQCQALLFMTASKALTMAFSKEVIKEPTGLRDIVDLKARRAHLVSQDHKGNQVSPDYPDSKGSRDLKGSRDRKDSKGGQGRTDSLGLKGHRGHRDPKDLRVLKGYRGHKGRGDREGRGGKPTTSTIFHLMF